jgi:hypothetical protein
VFDLIGWLVHVLILLLACAVALGLCAIAVARIVERIRSLRESDRAQFVRSQLLLIDRWCSYDFPIIEDICDHMGPTFDGRHPGSVDDFRDRLRAKYGERGSRINVY